MLYLERSNYEEVNYKNNLSGSIVDTVIQF